MCVDVLSVGADGSEVRLPIADCAGKPLERGRPVRSFPSYRGQRNFPGYYYAACVGALVGFESWLERDEAMALDFDPEVAGFASQPFRLVWAGSVGRMSHVPDFFARLRDGTGVVVDCRPANRIKDRDREVFESTSQICAEVGWGFRLVHGHDPVWLANVRWLAGYRHGRMWREPGASKLLGQLADPGPLIEGVRAVGDPIALLPVAYHLLWKRILRVDLAVRLDGGSVVSAA